MTSSSLPHSFNHITWDSIKFRHVLDWAFCGPLILGTIFGIRGINGKIWPSFEHYGWVVGGAYKDWLICVKKKVNCIPLSCGVLLPWKVGIVPGSAKRQGGRRDRVAGSLHWVLTREGICYGCWREY